MQDVDRAGLHGVRMGSVHALYCGVSSLSPLWFSLEGKPAPLGEVPSQLSHLGLRAPSQQPLSQARHTRKSLQMIPARLLAAPIDSEGWWGQVSCLFWTCLKVRGPGRIEVWAVLSYGGLGGFFCIR